MKTPNDKIKISVVQHYINCRKDVQVIIKIENLRDILLLDIAYDIAVKWFRQNNLRIIHIRW